MKLKKWIFNYLSILCLLSTQHLKAQDSTRHKFLPHHYKIQFAGGIGFFSVGAGYSNKKQWLQGDVFYGYVPKSIGGVRIHSLTGKLTVLPVKLDSKNFRINPFTLGLLMNYTPGKQYFGFTPENYPFVYYGMPTSLHAGAFIGGQLSKKLKKKMREFGLYYEVIAFDSEIRSYFSNKRTLDLDDVINIGIGITTSF